MNSINTGNSRVSDTGELAVPMTTLDEALVRTGWPYADLLVVDTEGFETHVMRGGHRCLSGTRYFYVEYAPEQLREQGSSPEEFLDLVSCYFPSMYIQSGGGQFFASKTYVRHLQELSERRGLLLDLLFSIDACADTRLIY